MGAAKSTLQKAAPLINPIAAVTTPGFGSFGGGGGGGGVFGSGSDPGALGTGMFRPDKVEIDEHAFKDNTRSSELRRAIDADMRRNNRRNFDKFKVKTSINEKPQQQFRGYQSRLAADLETQSRGEGPSVAGDQLARARDQNIADSMALAASQRGSDVGAGLRQVAQQTQAAQQSAARDAASARIQEQLSAREQLGTVSTAARGQDIGLAESQAAIAQKNALANQQAAFEEQKLKDATRQAYYNNLLGIAQQDRQAAMDLERLKVAQSAGYNQTQQAAYDSAGKNRGGLIKGAGEGLAAAFSDVRLKKDIKSAGKSNEMAKFIKSIKPSVYKYKDGKHGSGTYASPMAQDLEKTEIGKAMVSDTPEGKVVNYARAAGAMLATAGMLNDKVEGLEGKLAKVISQKRRK